MDKRFLDEIHSEVLFHSVQTYCTTVTRNLSKKSQHSLFVDLVFHILIGPGSIICIVMLSQTSDATKSKDPGRGYYSTSSQ